MAQVWAEPFDSLHPHILLPCCIHPAAGTWCAGTAAGRGCFSHSCQSRSGDEPLSATTSGVLTPISFHSRIFLETFHACELCPWFHMGPAAGFHMGSYLLMATRVMGRKQLVPSVFHNNLCPSNTTKHSPEAPLQEGFSNLEGVLCPAWGFPAEEWHTALYALKTHQQW